MPELPEVERSRKLAERVAVGRTIVRVQCADDDIVYDGVTPRRFSRALKRRRVEAAHRRGKQMWLQLDQGPHPPIHPGMTGPLSAPEAEALELESGIHSEGWPPRFTKLHVWLDDGGELAFTNARRLGRLRLRDRPTEEAPIAKLGFDPLLSMPTPKAFITLARKRSAPLKAALLDQRFAAGVGNWIADEVLYQARLDPRRRMDSLSDDELRQLRTKLKQVIAQAVKVDADKRRYPKRWLFHRRWGKQAGVLDADGAPIEHLEIGGRTTAWVPAVQR
jgi:formamidopyrimidine-DNA glycosylase